MKGKISKVLLCTCMMVCFLSVTASAATDAPRKVLNARDSVVRVVVSIGEEFYIGSGFTVESNSEYVITNCHVVEQADEIYVFVDTDHYYKATIHVYEPKKDICVLKLNVKLTGVKGLPLRNFNFESGIAVYALGYPGGADSISGNFVTNKQTMTVTDGIISAIRKSNVSISGGDTQTWVVQTNTAINGGNSGGPLMDKNGRVVGINTFGIDGAQSINGSIHVTELIAILSKNNIAYKAGSQITAEMVFIVVGIVALLGCVFLYLKKRGKADKTKPAAITTEQTEIAEKQGNRVELSNYHLFGGKLSYYDSVAAVEDFLEDYFQPDEIAVHAPLLFPANIFVQNGKELGFFKTVLTDADSKKAVEIYEGFSAPEVYGGMADQKSMVYFMGAVLYVLTEGKLPAAATARSVGTSLTFAENNVAKSLIREAMEMLPQNRPLDLRTFLYKLSEVKIQLFAKNIENTEVTESAQNTDIVVAEKPAERTFFEE